jgi:hypothetical protein
MNFSSGPDANRMLRMKILTRAVLVSTGNECRIREEIGSEVLIEVLSERCISEMPHD